jgi:hypothetical protein
MGMVFAFYIKSSAEINQGEMGGINHARIKGPFPFSSLTFIGLIPIQDGHESTGEFPF